VQAWSLRPFMLKHPHHQQHRHLPKPVWRQGSSHRRSEGLWTPMGQVR